MLQTLITATAMILVAGPFVFAPSVPEEVRQVAPTRRLFGRR
ncbi:hypothetical protein [Xaviernesmea oryzae]|nr:hypothetical protein [Xaviernesmea oryzae]SEK45159.1 hypothetical protein SAMN04487976_102218 [Xaviernesmea oryzae]